MATNFDQIAAAGGGEHVANGDWAHGAVAGGERFVGALDDGACAGCSDGPVFVGIRVFLQKDQGVGVLGRHVHEACEQGRERRPACRGVGVGLKTFDAVSERSASTQLDQALAVLLALPVREFLWIFVNGHRDLAGLFLRNHLVTRRLDKMEQRVVHCGAEMVDGLTEQHRSKGWDRPNA